MISYWTMFLVVAFLSALISPAFGQDDNHAHTSICDRLIVVVCDRSVDPRVADSVVKAVNQYVTDIVLGNAMVGEYGFEREYFRNELKRGCLEIPLWRPGDAISFYNFGIDRETLESTVNSAGGEDAFIDDLSREIFQLVGRLRVPDDTEARQFLHDNLSDVVTRDKAFPRYLTALLTKKLSDDPCAKQVLVVAVVGTRYGQRDSKKDDWEKIKALGGDYADIMSDFWNKFAESFVCSGNLLEMRTGGRSGLAVIVQELYPSEMPQISFADDGEIKASLRGDRVSFSKGDFLVARGGGDPSPFRPLAAGLVVKDKDANVIDFVPVATMPDNLDSSHVSVRFKDVSRSRLVNAPTNCWISLEICCRYSGHGGFEAEFPCVLSSEAVPISLQSVVAP